MTLSKSVEDSLKEAEQSLRNALAFAARGERSTVCTQIAKLMHELSHIQTIDTMFDKLEDRKPGDSGFFGTFFKDDDDD